MRGRAALLFVTMAVALVVAGGVALAAEITCPNRSTGECVGTRKADTMTGTLQADDMRGRGGGDTMRAGGGADKLLGGSGNDPDISAGSGNDSVEGEEGDDSLSGEGGGDTYVFRAGWGADHIPAEGEGAGTDTLNFSPSLVDALVDPLDVDLAPSANRDEVFTLFSNAGKQTLNFPDVVEIENVTGGKARDVIRGNNLPNNLSGSEGNDSLAGRDNNDVLSGGLGADDLNGGMGNDELNGGDGIDNDAYLFQNSWGEDEITGDAAGIDRLSFGQLDSPVTVNLAAPDTGPSDTEPPPPDVCSGNPCGSDPVNRVDWLSSVEIENVTGGTANDKLTGNDLANTLYGQAGDDEMRGEGNADEMYGRNGNDAMYGGPGVDKVYGDHPDFPTESGDDTINVADGDAGDTVDCGPGIDTVVVDVFPGSSGPERFADPPPHTSCEQVQEEPINPGT